ncbi:11038_t:CDS:2 [Gigaspora margarita]|uniref:11038_t:CDS:1 n=1 Tax=Gigaspora margarita TaxID=4874 RepID=A0ABN7VTC8_GIGMA|nr:11038_t:CDS:2 [Gigaspora margarita]
MKLFHFITFFTLFVLSFSVSFSDANPKTCKHVLLSATSDWDIKGQMGFYQDASGALWLTGTYQWGFHHPHDWDYCYTIRNKCGDLIYNLTDSLCMEYAWCSGCDGYYDYDKSSHCSWKSSKRSLFNKKRHEEDCVGPWGTKPWIVKVGDLSWDCDDKNGIKYYDCDGEDKYKKMMHHDHEDPPPKRLADQGYESGFYLIIEGQSKWGKRQSSLSPAAINVNNAGAAPPAAPAPAAAPPAAPPAAPAAPAPAAPAPAAPAPAAPAPAAPAPAAPAPAAPAPAAPAPAAPAPAAPAPAAPAPAAPAPDVTTSISAGTASTSAVTAPATVSGAATTPVVTAPTSAVPVQTGATAPAATTNSATTGQSPLPPAAPPTAPATAPATPATAAIPSTPAPVPSG